MMTCRQVSGLLPSYLDSELDPESRHLVEEHLQACEDCRLMLDEFRQVKSALKSLPRLKPPPGLHARVMDEVLKQQAARRSKSKVWFWRVGSFSSRKIKTAGLFLAACLVVALLSSSGTFFVMKSCKSSDFNMANDYSQANFRAIGGVTPEAPASAGEMVGSESGYEEGLDSLADSPPLMQKSSLGDLESFGEEQATHLERKLIRRANLTLEVPEDEIDKASKKTLHVVRAYQGYVESSSTYLDQNKGKSTVFYMTARIPSQHLDQAIEEISVLGSVTHSDIYEEDVTEQYVDLDARINNKVLQEQRLLQILGNAETVGELLQVEGELSRVRSDIESMKGRQNFLAKSSAMSFLSMSITEEGTKSPVPSPWRDIWKIFIGAWQDLFTFMARIAPALILLVLGYFGVRRFFRPKKA